MIINITNPANVEMTHKDTLESLKALTAQMTTLKATVDNPPPAPQVTFSPVIQPSEVAIQNNITNEVNPTPVTIENNTTVQPAPVLPAQVVIEKEGERRAKVKRDARGLITEITSEPEE